MNNDDVDIKLREDAAKTLLAAKNAALKNTGKKAGKQAAAESNTGRFGLRAVG